MGTETERQRRRKENSAIFLLRVSSTIYERKIRTAQKFHMESYMSEENANILIYDRNSFHFRSVYCYCCCCLAALSRMPFLSVLCSTHPGDQEWEGERGEHWKAYDACFCHAFAACSACVYFRCFAWHVKWTRRSKFGLSEMCNMILTW